MKRFSKLIAALALVLAAALLASSALPALTRAEDRNSVQPAWTVPEGYNAHDYEKCVNFLEQTDENGVKNGDKLSDNYDPNDPASWGNCFRWTTVNSEQRIHKIYADVRQLYGSLDVSGCTELTELYCTNNSITELNVSGCTELTELYCTYNNITELDVTHNTALSVLNCGFNNLIELDVTHNTALTELYCYANSLIELDLAHNAALEWLSCDGNSFTELDLSNNPLLGYDHIYAEGGGIIGYVYNPDNEAYISAYPVDGEVFEGFFDESGTLISAGYLEDLVYYFGFSGTPTGTVIARFSGESAPTPEPVEPTDEPAPVEPTDEPAPVEPTDEPAPVEPTDEPAPVEPTDEPAPVEPTAEPAHVEPTAVPAPAEPTPAPVPAPPATGTVALIGLGVISAISGLGITVFRKKND